MHEVLVNVMYENLFFTCTKFILVSVRKFIFLLLCGISTNNKIKKEKEINDIKLSSLLSLRKV
jgi:hypothetical protein